MLLKIIGAILLPPLLWIIWIYIKHLVDCLAYPRGPFPFPLVGNAYLLRKGAPYREFVNLQKLYGDIFGFSIGSVRYVVVNSFEGIRDVLIKKGLQFAGRPKITTFNGNIQSLTNSDPGPRFKALRKLASSSLKIYAEGLLGMERIAVEEYSHLKKKLLSMKGEVSMHSVIEQSILNIICMILFNHRYEEDNEEFQDIIKYSRLSLKAFNETSYTSSIPWLRYLPTASSQNIFEVIKIRDPFLKQKLQEHKRLYNANNLRDVTDALIKVSLEEMDSDEKITEGNIEFLLNDFIIAGSETSANTILWFIVYILHWPEYQDKLYDEIVKVTKGSRYPSINDRPMLHLMQAVIHETLRLSSVGPLGLCHKAMENSSICGKYVPKGALILTNLWSIHHDEKYWNNAMSFYPERWLEKTGEFNSKLGFAYFPFSSGPRSCIGETLAKTELFVFFSRLVTDCLFEKPIGKELPRLDGQSGVTCPPFEFDVVITPRD